MTQVLPSDDSFSDAGLTQASSFLDYIARHQPWSTDPAHASNGTGFSYGSSYFGARAQLYTGWFNQAVGALFPGASALPAAVSTGVITAFTPRPTSFLRRDLSVADVRVATSFQVQSTDPSYMRSNGVTMMAGVGARVQPGANTSPTDPNACATAPGSGYWFVVMHDTGAGLGTKFELLRVDSGTVTRLAESPIGPTTFTAWGQSGAFPTTYWRPLKIELHVYGEGSNVRLDAYTTAESGGHAGVKRLLFSVLDSSASKITSAGMTGLLCGSEYLLTASPQRVAAPCFNWWEASTTDEATVYFRDEWTRIKYQLGLFRSTSSSGDKAHFSGYSLMTGWYGDTQTGDATGPWLALDTANDRIVVPASSRPPSILSVRPADDPRVQDRSVVVRFTSTGSSSATERYAGIGLRGTIDGGITSAFNSGYVVRLYFKDSTSEVRMTLGRILPVSGTGVETVIAQKLAPMAFSLDTNITIRFAIETLTVPDPINGYARMKVYINGVQIVLVAPTSPVLGIEFAADGTVTDTSSSRVLSGYGESIYVWAPTGTREIAFDTWAQGGDSGPVEVPENDQASIEVPGEFTTTAGELTLPVGARAVVRHLDPRIQHVMESRHRYLGRRVSYARRVWSVEATGVSQAEADTFLALLESARGPEGALDWTPPGLRQSPVVVHVVPDTIDLDLVAPDIYALRFELQELRLSDA